MLVVSFPVALFFDFLIPVMRGGILFAHCHDGSGRYKVAVEALQMRQQKEPALTARGGSGYNSRFASPFY
jgi:hypothetical protein